MNHSNEIRRFLTGVCAVALLVAGTGCASMNRNANAIVLGGICGTVGGVAGFAATNGNGEGAAGGAAVGAALGGAICVFRTKPDTHSD